MTPEQVALVKSSFAEMGPQTSALAVRFYERLFEVAPPVRTLFSQDPAVQESVFVSELGVIVSSISRFDAFVARARDLGVRHAAYGITYLDYETAGRVLLETLADTLGPAFTDELQEAWRLAFDLMAETMMQGAADAHLSKPVR
jgi:nitric oxide dioxygenase